jgi:hemolysin activation/secretion protein
MAPYPAPTSMTVIVRLACASLAGALALSPAAAQTPPDAGRTLQDLLQPPAPPAERQPPTLSLPPARTGAASGGPTVLLRGLRFEGNVLFDDEQLAAQLADAVGQRLDLEGLRRLADRIEAFYRAAGHPFVRAVLPPQELDDGWLRLKLVEGRYGQLQWRADAADAEAARAWLSGLQPGQPIALAPLERATLLLGELPGLRSRAVLRPGDEVGTGDLEITLEREAAWIGDASFDNHGNRYSGALRLQARAEGRSLLRLGDRLEAEVLATDEDLQHGVLGYGLPLGGDGWRLRLSAARTRYALGREFAALQASGQAQVLAAGFSLAPWRSGAGNLDLQVEWQDKRLDDRQRAVGAGSGKRSRALPVTLRFDRRAASAGTLTWGTLSWTPGQLVLDAAARASDRLDTAGAWQTVRLDVTHRRALSPAWTLSARLSGQWADRNLDASEGFSLGGAHGVRAYPAGEAPGDTGWLVQLELRRPVTIGEMRWEPFVFHDHGQARPDVDPLPGARAPTRTLAGIGVGLRASQGPWRAEVQFASRTQGGPAHSVPGDDRHRAWFSIGRGF